MQRHGWVVLLACAAALTGCGAPAHPATGTSVDDALPAVADKTVLVRQAGSPISLRSLRGKVVVLAPFLTMCQETCPLTTANLHRVASEYAHTRDVEFVEMTVDPERDTPARLRGYERLFGALPNWTLVTGEPARVLGVWRALGVATDKTKPDDEVRDWLTGKRVTNYDVHHQDVVEIIGRSGHLRWLTVGHPDARTNRLPLSMRHFLNDEGRDNFVNPSAQGSYIWSADDLRHA